MKLEDILGVVSRTAALGTFLALSSPPAYAADESVDDSTDITQSDTRAQPAQEVDPTAVKKPYQWRDIFVREPTQAETNSFGFGPEVSARLFFDSNSVDLAAAVSVYGRLGAQEGPFGKLRVGFLGELTGSTMPDIPGVTPSVVSASQNDDYGNTGTLDTFDWKEVRDYFNGIFGGVEGGYGWKVGDITLYALGGSELFRHTTDRANWSATQLTATDSDGVVLDQDPIKMPSPGNRDDTSSVNPALSGYVGIELRYEKLSATLSGGPVVDLGDAKTKGALNLMLQYGF